MHKKNESAVSPVVGVMLMLVVTIIIAAIVSGVAGGLASGQNKVPQAQISGKFSVTDGFTIIHNGGDALPVKDIVLTVRNSRLFGPNVEEISAQVVNKSLVKDMTTGKTWENPDGSLNITAFRPGDKVYISIENCDPYKLQDVVAPYPKGYLSFDGTHYTYDATGGGKPQFWALCFVNPENVGKTFYLEVSDSGTGKLISKSEVTIAP